MVVVLPSTRTCTRAESAGAARAAARTRTNPRSTSRRSTNPPSARGSVSAAARELDSRVGNWPVLLKRFAEDRAPIFLRPDADTSATLRRLQAAGVRLGAFTDAPESLARVAASQLGAARRLETLEAGAGAL